MPSSLIRFSCVVDAGAEFAEQATRWARSLIELAAVAPDDIVVHYTRRTEPAQLAALKRIGVTTLPVHVFSKTRPHLNKLMQLRSAFLRGADLAVLCDCDTLFIADPRPYFAGGTVAAAVVDRPNPPMTIWNELLERSGLGRQRPDIPCGSSEELTLFENRNGGLYVLPGRTLADFDPVWRRWAEWLDGQADVLGRFAFNSDQISFALACIELEIEPALLPKGLNCPTHLPADHVGDCVPVMLHYHRKVDEAGQLMPIGQPTVDRAVAFANARLALPARARRKRRLLLHVGLPKTGTSALQQWCEANADAFRRQGIRYPTPSATTQMPKHQFVVNDLMRRDLSRTVQALDEGDEEMMVLSSEGLTNHLYDFPPASLERFRERLRAFDVTVFLVHRQPDDWVVSYHKQCAINPRIAAYDYGTALELAEFRRLPRVRKLMNIADLSADCASAFGGEVVSAPFGTDWLGRFIGLCGFQTEAPVELPRINESIDDWILGAILRINRLGLSNEARIAWLGSLQRFTKSGHVGLKKHETTASDGGLWRYLDPALAQTIIAADGRGAGYRELVQSLRGDIRGTGSDGVPSPVPRAIRAGTDRPPGGRRTSAASDTGFG